MPPRRDDLDDVEESDGGPDNPDTPSNNPNFTVRQDMSTTALVQRSQPQPRRKPSSHIPRPPNAFILFRSSFIRSNHVPGKVEGNHSTLSKIIGLCWKALSQEERQTWEEKARIAQTEHRNLYPDWRWRPEANTLAKKRGTRKRKLTYNVQPSKQGDDGQDDQELHKDKGKPRDKGKARERSSDDDIDPDARIVKIAELLKQGITGADLETALDEWQHTLSNKDRRPTKQRRTRLTQDVITTLDASASLQSQLDPTASNSSQPSLSPQASSSANPSFSPNDLPNKSLTHVLKRSSPDSIRSSDLPRLTTEPTSAITQSSSHTPSPHTPFYTSHRPVHSVPRPVFTPETTITWVQNTTPASFSNSQPSFPQYWTSHNPSTHSTQAAPFGSRYDTPVVTTEGLGYEDTSAFDQRYSEHFEHSRDDSERVEWTHNAGRQGLCAVITDPLPCAENSITNPPIVSIASRNSVSNEIHPTSPDRSFFPTDPSTTSATTFIPSTYSTLTGWAGEYDARSDESSTYPSTSALDWYPRNWQDIARAPMWNQESGNVDVLRPNSNVSHHKIAYPVPTVTTHPPPSAGTKHQSNA